jgi:hypothetical protein
MEKNMTKTGMPKGRPNAVSNKSSAEVRVIPSVPEGLGREGAHFWAKTFTSAEWLDYEMDFYCVFLAAKIVDDISIARQEVLRSGRYQILPNGVSARSAASIDLEHLHISLNSYLSALGLTPTGRAKMGIEARQENDPLAELSRRRLARESNYWNKDK